MPKEVSLQYDMFSGELVDTRSAKQKRRDTAQAIPRQTEMFPQRELAQFGVRARPQLPLSPKTRLELAAEDARTEEEKERDRMKTAESRTYSLFGDAPHHPQPELSQMKFPSGLRLPLIEAEDSELSLAVQLIEEVNILFWSTRDEEYERLRNEAHLQGDEIYVVGDAQLEIWRPDRSGCYLITYSEMGIVENIVFLTSFLK